MQVNLSLMRLILEQAFGTPVISERQHRVVRIRSCCKLFP